MAISFDEYAHLLKKVMIRAGQEVRKAQGLPVEPNISKIYKDMCDLVGIPPIVTSVTQHPWMRKPDGSVDSPPPVISPPKKQCPQCGKYSYILVALCKSCKDAEGGKYKSEWRCIACGHIEKSEKAITVWLDELGIDFQSQSKKSLGIDIVTDEGVK